MGSTLLKCDFARIINWLKGLLDLGRACKDPHQGSGIGLDKNFQAFAIQGILIFDLILGTKVLPISYCKLHFHNFLCEAHLQLLLFCFNQ